MRSPKTVPSVSQARGDLTPHHSRVWLGPASARKSRCGRPASRSDVEAEHHPALVMLGDVAMRHPTTGVRDVQEDVDRLACADEDGVLPDEVRLDDPVPREDEEAAGAVYVEWVWHRVVGVHLVDETDLDLVADGTSSRSGRSRRPCR